MLSSSENLYDSACRAILALPGAEIYRFSARSEAEAARVGGKWFAVLAAPGGIQHINLKADPADVAAILHTYPDFTAPAWHMNKRHWYSLVPGRDLTETLLKELISESYAIVLEKMRGEKVNASSISGVGDNSLYRGDR